MQFNTYSGDRANLDNSALCLDEQRQECLAHGDNGEEVGLEHRANLRKLHFHSRDGVICGNEYIFDAIALVYILRPLVDISHKHRHEQESTHALLTR